jgi:hypothetical protein
MSPAKKLPIEIAGETLYGPAWQERLADALGVSPKTVWRWKTGADVPAGVWRDIAKLCDGRAKEIRAMGKQIRETLAKQA